MDPEAARVVRVEGRRFAVVKGSRILRLFESRAEAEEFAKRA